MGTPRVRRLLTNQRVVWWTSFAVIGVTFSLYSITLPMMSAPDEAGHAVKAAAVARGQLSYHYTHQQTYGGSFPVTPVRVPGGYARARALQACWLASVAQANACARAHALGGSRDDTTTVITPFGSYPPLYYGIVGLPSLVLGPDTAVYAMRLVSALLCAAMVASALTSALATSRGGLLVVAVGLGLTPAAMNLNASINPNGLEIAAALAVWLALLDLLSRQDLPTRLILRVAVCSVLLVASRPASPEILACIVAGAGIAAGSRARLRAVWADHRARLAAAVVALATLASVAYTTVAHTSTALTGYAPATGSRLAIARTALGRTSIHLREMFVATRAVFIYSTNAQGKAYSIHLVGVPLPGFVMPLWIACACVLAGAGLVVGSWHARIAIVGLIVATIGSGVLADVLTAPTYGYGWQGRYALPMAVGIAILGAWVLEQSARVDRGAIRVISGVSAVGLGAAYVVSQLALLSFNLHLDAEPWWRGAFSGPWVGPSTPALLATGAVLAGIVYGAWLFAMSQHDPPASIPTSGVP